MNCMNAVSLEVISKQWEREHVEIVQFFVFLQFCAAFCPFSGTTLKSMTCSPCYQIMSEKW